MLGCDFCCAYCQNWFTSQSLRDDASTIKSTSVSAKDICDRANGARVVVSTYNESDEELSKIAEFIAGISKDIPWRVTAFHPDCKIADRKRTPVENLLRAY